MKNSDDGVRTLWRLTNEALSDTVVATATEAGGQCHLTIVSGVEGSIMDASYPDVETLLREASDHRMELERQGWEPTDE